MLPWTTPSPYKKKMLTLYGPMTSLKFQFWPMTKYLGVVRVYCPVLLYKDCISEEMLRIYNQMNIGGIVPGRWSLCSLWTSQPEQHQTVSTIKCFNDINNSLNNNKCLDKIRIRVAKLHFMIKNICYVSSLHFHREKIKTHLKK